MKTLLIMFFVWISPSVLIAQVKIPCFEQKGTRWVPTEEECVMSTKAEFQRQVERMVKLDHIQKVELPSQQAQLLLMQKREALWQQSEASWKQQSEVYKKLMEYHQKESDIWKKEAQKQHAPSIFKSPTFWFWTGVALSTAVFVGVTLAVTLIK